MVGGGVEKFLVGTMGLFELPNKQSVMKEVQYKKTVQRRKEAK